MAKTLAQGRKAGSGRRSKTEELVNSMKGSQFEPKAPIATEMFLPNLSGDHSKGRVRETPTTDLQIANKKYVDDQIAASSTAPGGSDTQVQFNDGGSFGGDANLVWDKTNNRLGINQATPLAPIHIKADSNNLLFHLEENNGTEFMNIEIEATGDLVFVSDSGAIKFEIEDASTRLLMPGRLQHVGDSNTYMNYNSDEITLAAGSAFLEVKGSGTSTLKWNKSSNKADVQFFGNNDDNTFYLDGSVDSIGIGTSSPICKLDINGGFAANLTSQTGTYTATKTDHTIICGAGNETFTVTLPTASGVSGLIYNIKNIGTGTITVDGASAETIDGATTKALSSQFDSITIQCDGSNWHIL